MMTSEMESDFDSNSEELLGQTHKEIEDASLMEKVASEDLRRISERVELEAGLIISAMDVSNSRGPSNTRDEEIARGVHKCETESKYELHGYWLWRQKKLHGASVEHRDKTSIDDAPDSDDDLYD